jgi:hypothetical protein
MEPAGAEFKLIQSAHVANLDDFLLNLKSRASTVDRNLEEAVRTLQQDILKLEFDPNAIVPGVSASEAALLGQVVYTDTRVDELWRLTFPVGHEYCNLFAAWFLREVRQLRRAVDSLPMWGRTGEAQSP